MAEIIGDFPRIDGKGKSSHITGEAIKEINEGTEGLKHLIAVSLESGVRKRALGPMFIKTLDADKITRPDELANEALEKHRFLKRLGLPVTPTLRYDNKHHRFLMTDVTEGGKYIIVDKHNPLNKSGLGIKNLDSVKENLLGIAKGAFASGNGVMLTADSFSILVDENGLGKPIILDIVKRSWRITRGRSEKYNLSFSQNQAGAGAQAFIQKYLS